MPLSLRIPPEKEKLIKTASKKAGKTKSAYIIEAIDEKIGVIVNREKAIRDLAGWMSHKEARDLKKSIAVFDRIDEGDWH